jgi:septal ring factor EnvC (AmiA/AmiB activator)
LEVVSAKIKVMASRKPYLKNPAIVSGAIGANTVSNDVVSAEDVNMDHMWRWEVTLLDLLPEDSVRHVRLARAARRRVQQRFNATVNLLRALDESLKLLQETDPPKAQLDKALARVSREEDKVLKFEQEAEKARLLTEAKKQKEAQKEASKNQKEREKEEKKRAGEERKREKEEAKKKKDEQALTEQKKKQKEKEKQKSSLMAFFGKPSAKKVKAVKPTGNHSANAKLIKLPISKTGFSLEEFRDNINSQPSLGKVRPFASLSKRARASRKRKSKRVKMRVFVSARSPEDPFAPPAFAEERVIEVRDRNKFLAFLAFDTEDHR